MDKLKPPTRAVVAWGLYDWANSAFPTVITTFIFATYFTQGIAKDPILGTSQWGNATALAGLIIAILSPILGAIADHKGKRKPWLAFFTLVTVISAALLWFAKPFPDYINWALTWVVLGTVGFEISAVFYNTMIRDLVTSQYWGRLSGWSWGIGYAGGLVCLILALLFIQTNISWLPLNTKMAEQIRICGPLVACWFALFSLPLFILTPDRPSTGMSIKNAIHKGFVIFSHTLQNLRDYKQVAKFLLAHMIYIDGLNTLFAFGGIYAAGTFGFNTAEIIKFGIGMNITAGIGAVGFAWLDDYLGSKNTILIALSAMIVSGIGILLVHSLIAFWILALFLGLFVGPVQAASRSLIIRIAPPERMAEMFGFYAFAGKATAFAGPWLVGLITLMFASQRIGMITVIVFLAAGTLLLLDVQTAKNK
jgi:MFS transporter, UMF1 family